MKFNPQLIKHIAQSNLDVNITLLYLLGLYHNIKTDIIPEVIANFVKNELNIFTVTNNKVVWNIELFEDRIESYEWVHDYVALFKNHNPKKGGHYRESVSRLKEFFKNNPQYNPDDVMNATKFYLRQTDPGYIRFPHFFIKKGSGINAIYDLQSWVENYKESTGTSSNQGINSITRRLS